MELDIRPEAEANVVAVKGMVIAQDSVRLGRELERIIAEAPDGQANLVINVAGVPYLDSQGLGAIVRARQAALARRAAVVLSQAPPNIERLFTVAKLTDIIPIYPSDEDALNALAARKSLSPSPT